MSMPLLPYLSAWKVWFTSPMVSLGSIVAPPHLLSFAPHATLHMTGCGGACRRACGVLCQACGCQHAQHSGGKDVRLCGRRRTVQVRAHLCCHILHTLSRAAMISTCSMKLSGSPYHRPLKRPYR